MGRRFQQEEHSGRELLRALALVMAIFGSAIAGPNSAQGTTFYVDWALGNNSYDGLSSVVTNGDGPMRNISNAIAATSDGDTIVVASGYYAESTWDTGTKSLSLNPQGQVTVCDTDLCGSDSIGDGILDWWRQKYFGSPNSTNSMSCASCDPDGDGISNLQEYQLGTDPTDINSPFANNPPGNLFFYDNLGRLAVEVGTNGTDAAFYNYDAVGNITSIQRQTVGQINLFEFSPLTGSGNTTITLRGTGFSTILTNNTVLFGSITAQVVSATFTQIKVLVPTNAVTSLISVSTPLGVSTNSQSFTAAISVQIFPNSVTMLGTFAQQFMATVYGTNTQSVTWTLNGWIPAGSNTAWGLITTNGLYSITPGSPPPTGIVTVNAQSTISSNPLTAGAATITIGGVSGPIYSPTVSDQPGVPDVLGPIYSPSVSVCSTPCPPLPP